MHKNFKLCSLCLNFAKKLCESTFLHKSECSQVFWQFVLAPDECRFAFTFCQTSWNLLLLAVIMTVIHGQMGGVTPHGPKKSTAPMDHFGPSHRVKKKDLKVFFGLWPKKFLCGYNWFKKHHILLFLPEIVNFSCFLSFYSICGPKRAIFLLWNDYALKFMIPNSKATPHAGKNLTPHQNLQNWPPPCKNQLPKYGETWRCNICGPKLGWNNIIRLIKKSAVDCQMSDMSLSSIKCCEIFVPCSWLNLIGQQYDWGTLLKILTSKKCIM